MFQANYVNKEYTDYCLIRYLYRLLISNTEQRVFNDIDIYNGENHLLKDTFISVIYMYMFKITRDK